jgi:hypothetical protein
MEFPTREEEVSSLLILAVRAREVLRPVRGALQKSHSIRETSFPGSGCDWDRAGL